MKRRGFLIFSVTILLLILFALNYYLSHRQADFGIVGKYDYTITDSSLFKRTYLSDDSYGYLITSSPIPGLEVKGFDLKRNKEDLIVSLGYPIKAVYTNTYSVRNQSGEYGQPVEIIQDIDKKRTEFVYLYYIRPKGKYRLLLP